MDTTISTDGHDVATAPSRIALAPALVAVAYLVLGVTLALSRLVSLGKSFWLDEAVFVEQYVREGPRQILTGGGLSHELYGVLDWMTASFVGESAVAFRLWSAVPFIAGATLVTLWLHKRHDPLAGVLFLFLTTVSPLLLDISRQARGYGLAFLAMAVVVVAALEAQRSGKTLAVASMCVAGVIGSWTLPQLSIAFAATLVVVAVDRRLRTRVVVGGLVSMAAILVWFFPHFQQVHAAGQSEAVTAGTTTMWLVTAPIDQIVLPALIWIDGATLSAGTAWLPLVVLVVMVMAASPLVQERDDAALILLAGPVATIIAFWIGDVHAVPRFLSYLLVPLFMVLGSGGAAIARGKRPFRTAICALAMVALTVHFAVLAPDVVRLPREANREAAARIETNIPVTSPVYSLIRDPWGLDYYLDRHVQVVRARDVTALVCGSDRPVGYVTKPWDFGEPPIPCLSRAGAEHFRFRQYARGRELSVWLVPPAA